MFSCNSFLPPPVALLTCMRRQPFLDADELGTKVKKKEKMVKGNIIMTLNRKLIRWGRPVLVETKRPYKKKSKLRDFVWYSIKKLLFLPREHVFITKK